MWTVEGSRLMVSHHRHGVKPPVPGGTRLASLHHQGFLFLHLKSKPRPGLHNNPSLTLLSLPSITFLPFSLPPFSIGLNHNQWRTTKYINEETDRRLISAYFQALRSLSISVWCSICVRYQNMSLCRWD